MAKLVIDRQKNDILPSLLESDQLKASIKQSKNKSSLHLTIAIIMVHLLVLTLPDRLLKSFKEAEITFPPTYKYIPGSSDFDDSAKQRVPS